MEENIASQGFVPRRLRLDPWGVEMGAAYLEEPSAEGRSEVVLDVEYRRWLPLRPALPARSYEVFLLDGSRRLEARVLLEQGTGEPAFGALGSYGVGAVACYPQQGRPAEFIALEVERLCVIGSGQSLPDFTVPASRAGQLGVLSYQGVSIASPEPEAVVRQLQFAMLEAESLLAARLSQQPEAILVCDGPRPWIGASDSVVGYLKTIHELRIDDSELAVVRALAAGERSPLYLLKGAASEHDTFQCFVRLRDPHPWLYSLAGIVRLQFYAGRLPEQTLPRAARLADYLTALLPHFASRAYQDPRAPQQLLPVRALEKELARRMGDMQLIRRRITDHLAHLGS